MEIRAVAGGSGEIEALEQINREAIPDNERNSLADLLGTGAEVLGIFTAEGPAGFLVIRRFRQVVYLAYLAVRADLRSGGIGGRALRELIRQNPDRQVVVEFEAPDEACGGNDIRLRRKRFYLRNGFHETGWYTYYDETEFEIGCSVPDYDPGAFEAFVEYLGTIVSDHIPKPYRKAHG